MDVRALMDERDTLSQHNAELRSALSELSAVYSSCFDLVDGGLIIMQPSVERFEKANAAARKALGFNDVSFEDEE